MTHPKTHTLLEHSLGESLLHDQAPSLAALQQNRGTFLPNPVRARARSGLSGRLPMNFCSFWKSARSEAYKSENAKLEKIVIYMNKLFLCFGQFLLGQACSP